MKKHSTEAIPLILDFCHWLDVHKKSPNTVKTYKRELEKYQEWLQEKKRDINHLEKADIQAYIDYLEEQQKSLATIDKTIGAIRTFAKFLEKPGLTFGIEIKPVEKKSEIETLSGQEYSQLLRKVKEDGNLRNTTIVYVLLHTGIRVSELCSLNRSHVDLENHELIVEKQNERRVIPLSQETMEYLQNFLGSPDDEEPVFVSNAGERLTERAVQYMLKKYDVNPQKLRHTFCQRLIDNHVDVETVSRLAGHKDINVTKRYVKFRMNKRKVEDAINQAFANGPNE
ncbi:tyrosine-type recombinase/integrase [Bacillus tuaregi]|uniref:tyrosine-type recombinase/integrase n=1 Tax=Bacillus tuaregi TaxID=1816695 RepID=UPI0008F814D2|nr:tyrosine-type recombinase/integrase [Bacillus tuaregi]